MSTQYAVMPDATDPLAAYLEHVQARVRARQGRVVPAGEEASPALLPGSIAALATRQPNECLALIVRTLAEPVSPDAIAVIGEGLLEDLLNESAGRIADQVTAELKTNKRFRQAFGFGNYSSVDPAVVEDWVGVLERLGTTKARERKSTWKRG